MRRCSHILQMIVNEGLKEMDELVARWRNYVKYGKSFLQWLMYPQGEI